VFYFETLLNQGLAGIDRTAMLTTITGIAYAILVIGFLAGLYQAAMRGGDLQALGVTAIKYVVIAVLVANWSTVFREVNSSSSQVAHAIYSSSTAGDVFLSWLDQLKQQFEADGTTSFLNLVSNTNSALITVLLVFVAYVLYVLAIVVFGFFYTLYGCVLYVLGPLVLALLPMPGVGQLAKSFATNIFIWSGWGILYAIFAALITAIQARLPLEEQAARIREINQKLMQRINDAGAVKDVGAYCGFVSFSGEPLEWISRCKPLAPNGLHATVVAPAFVRIHAFRDQQTFALLITLHELVAQVARRRPALYSTILFHGAGGTLPGLPQQSLAREILPEFRMRSGDPMPVPATYLEAARTAVAGTRCLGCRSPHLLVAPGSNGDLSNSEDEHAT